MTSDELDPLGPTGPRPAGGAGDVLAAAARFGRFVIVRRIGAGGMGEVYEARDQQLGRSVALKVLHGGRRGGHEDARLLREAQALAQLAHPNVVAVHDVGTADGRVYIAMEHVDGATFEELVRGPPRPWPELLGLFVQAARGLVAAHARRIVHRDFKPSNVLLDGAGRVRVSDFGLARLAQDDSAETGTAPASDDLSGGTLSLDDEAPSRGASPGLLGAALTRDGALVGTPRYMAPEQRARRGATELSDQFAFCVVLWETLFRDLPPVLGGPPAGRSVPRWLVRALERGLSRRPEDRHASMAALLEVLERTPVRRRRRVALALGALAVAGAAAVSWLLAPSREAEPLCARDRAAEMWSPAVRQALWSAFNRFHDTETAGAIGRVDTLLDKHIHAWSQAWVAACAEQPRSLARRRLVCLDRVASRLQALLDVWQSQPVKPEQAIGTAANAGDVRGCSDEETLPSAAVEDGRVAAVRRMLDQAEALNAVGAEAQAGQRAAAALADARTIGEPSLLAEALDAVGESTCAQGQIEPGLARLREAVQAAGQARNDVLQAKALADLIYCTGVRARRGAEAIALFPAAEAAVARLPGREDLRARLLAIQGGVLHDAGRTPEAIDYQRRAVTIGMARLGLEHTFTLAALGNLSTSLGEVDRLDEELAINERVLAGSEKLFGERHPRVIAVLINLMVTSDNLGHTDAAVAYGERALRLAREVLPPDHPFTAKAMMGVARQRDIQDRLEEARALFAEAVASSVRRLGPDHLDVAEVQIEAANFLDGLGDFAGAQELFELGLATQRHAMEAESPQLAYSTLLAGMHLRDRGDLPGARRAAAAAASVARTRPDAAYFLADALRLQAEIAHDDGRRDEATALADEAAKVFRGVHPADDPQQVSFVTCVAQNLLDAGKAAAALPLLDAAVALGERRRAHPLSLALARFQLARSAWLTGDQARARSLAEAARVTLAARRQPELAEVERWQREHR